MLKSKLVVFKVLFIVILLLKEITLQLTGHSSIVVGFRMKIYQVLNIHVIKL